jgi:hypothetical protein
MAAFFGKLAVTKPSFPEENAPCPYRVSDFYRICDAYVQHIGFRDDPHTDYDYEDQLQAARESTLMPPRKGIHKPQHAPELAQEIRKARKRIETTFRQITAKLPYRLHAITPEGFASKILALFVAFAILVADEAKTADQRRGAS